MLLMQLKKKIERFNKKNNHLSTLDIYKGLNDLQRCSDRSIIRIRYVKVKWKVTSQFSWTTFRSVLD